MRKRITAFLCLLCLLFLSGCAGDGRLLPPNELSVNEPFSGNRWGVTLTAENVSPVGMTLICACSDTDDREVTTGAAYELYTLQSQSWVPYERTDGKVGNMAWESIAYIISEDTPVVWELDWTWMHGELPAGEYLLMKTFAVSKPDEHSKDYEEFQVFTEFRIEP